jgi:hypothetical protein
MRASSLERARRSRCPSRNCAAENDAFIDFDNTEHRYATHLNDLLRTSHLARQRNDVLPVKN